jgi:hypothetical protein
VSSSSKHDEAQRRRFQRIQLSVPLKFLGDDLAEHKGTLLDISAGGLALASDARPALGVQIVVYVDQLGRLEGRVVRHLERGFAIELAASDAKRERLADRLTWFANRESLPHDADLQPITIAAREKPHFILGDGREIECRVLDMSMHGVWLQVNVKPALGEEVTIGRMRGRVCQHHPTGIAIEFLAAGAH